MCVVVDHLSKPLSKTNPQPNNTRWLTPAERRLAQARLAEDASEADQDRAEDSLVKSTSGIN